MTDSVVVTISSLPEVPPSTNTVGKSLPSPSTLYSSRTTFPSPCSANSPPSLSPPPAVLLLAGASPLPSPGWPTATLELPGPPETSTVTNLPVARLLRSRCTSGRRNWINSVLSRRSSPSSASTWMNWTDTLTS